MREYTPVPPMPDTHMQASFTHLNGYSAYYYTYMWSLVIAKDLFSRFDQSNLLAAEPARRYRDLILSRGGSAPAARLVEDFLGPAVQLRCVAEMAGGRELSAPLSSAVGG